MDMDGLRFIESVSEGFPSYSYVLFIVFKLYRDDWMMIMQGCEQWNPADGWKNSCLQRVSSPGLLRGDIKKF